jgi:hypothetical protein
MTLMFKNWAEVEAVFAVAFDVPPIALAAAAREGGDVKQAPGETPQSGAESATPNPLSNPLSPSRGNEDA